LEPLAVDTAPNERTLTVSNPAAPTAIGVSAPRVDAIEKVTGAARYTADVPLPAPALWAKVLRSPFAHAKILRIDATSAAALAGVHAVLTGADVAGRLTGRRIKDTPILAENVVRFVGEPVAAVAADDKETAERALALIDVAYEEPPALFDPLDATAPDAMLLHPDVTHYEGLPQPLDAPTNVFTTNEWVKGDIEAGLASADVVVENTFTTAAMHQAYLEPNACLVWIDDDGRMQVWASTKVPFTAKTLTAQATSVPADRVRLNPVTIGGDFGAKGQAKDVPLCYFLAKATERPIRMVYDYNEELQASNPRHSAVLRLKTGVMRDGRLVAHQIDVVYNTGAYAGCLPGALLPISSSGGPYRVANTRLRASYVYTNTVPRGYMRGPGRVQLTYAVESQIDCVAQAIGMDPVEFRLKNLVRDGDETAIGERFASARAIETLEAAVEASGYRAPKGAGVGRGIAVTKQEAGGGEAHASVTLGLDGSVVLSTPIFEQGTGTYTMLQQVAAECLGMTPERVRIHVWDTDAVANDTGISADRGTRLGSQAAHEAADQARREIYKLAAEFLSWPEETLSMGGDDVLREDTGERTPWRALIERTGAPVVGHADIDDAAPAAVTSFSAQVAEVAVDLETGSVTLVSLTTAHDTGRIINPLGHQGQINGGAVQGMGYGLMEELLIENGSVRTLSFADYKIPTIADVPLLRTVLLESDDGAGPVKVKSAGEIANAPTAPAVANAIADAIGWRIHDLPLTAERVYRALKS
jgi:CO/xanthine dehydrogenase Mo-binding subunit